MTDRTTACSSTGFTARASGLPCPQAFRGSGLVLPSPSTVTPQTMIPRSRRYILDTGIAHAVRSLRPVRLPPSLVSLVRAGKKRAAAHHRELSRTMIVELANSLALEDPLRSRFRSTPAVGVVLDACSYGHAAARWSCAVDRRASRVRHDARFEISVNCSSPRAARPARRCSSQTALSVSWSVR